MFGKSPNATELWALGGLHWSHDPVGGVLRLVGSFDRVHMGRKARARRALKTAVPEYGPPSAMDIWALRLTGALAVLLGAAMVVGVLFPIPILPEGWNIALLCAVEVFFLLRAYIAFRARARIEMAMWIMLFGIVLLAV
jgi:hypothetical protein